MAAITPHVSPIQFAKAQIFEKACAERNFIDFHKCVMEYPGLIHKLLPNGADALAVLASLSCDSDYRKVCLEHMQRYKVRLERISVEKQTQAYRTAIQIAAKNNYWDMVDMLFEMGARLEPSFVNRDFPVFLVAAEQRQWDLFKKFIPKVTDINIMRPHLKGEENALFREVTALWIIAWDVTQSTPARYDIIEALLKIQEIDVRLAPKQGANKGCDPLWMLTEKVVCHPPSSETDKQQLWHIITLMVSSHDVNAHTSPLDTYTSANEPYDREKLSPNINKSSLELILEAKRWDIVVLIITRALKTQADNQKMLRELLTQITCYLAQLDSSKEFNPEFKILREKIAELEKHLQDVQHLTNSILELPISTESKIENEKRKQKDAQDRFLQACCTDEAEYVSKGLKDSTLVNIDDIYYTSLVRTINFGSYRCFKELLKYRPLSDGSTREKTEVINMQMVMKEAVLERRWNMVQDLIQHEMVLNREEELFFTMTMAIEAYEWDIAKQLIVMVESRQISNENRTKLSALKGTLFFHAVHTERLDIAEQLLKDYLDIDFNVVISLNIFSFPFLNRVSSSHTHGELYNICYALWLLARNVSKTEDNTMRRNIINQLISKGAYVFNTATSVLFTLNGEKQSPNSIELFLEAREWDIAEKAIISAFSTRPELELHVSRRLELLKQGINALKEIQWNSSSSTALDSPLEKLNKTLIGLIKQLFKEISCKVSRDPSVYQCWKEIASLASQYCPEEYERYVRECYVRPEHSSSSSTTSQGVMLLLYTQTHSSSHTLTWLSNVPSDARSSTTSTSSVTPTSTPKQKGKTK